MSSPNGRMYAARNRRRRIAFIVYPVLLISVLLLWSLSLIVLTRKISETETGTVVAALGKEDHSQRTLLEASKSKDSAAFSTIDSNDGGAANTTAYAYAWVMGGIHEDRPAYKGFLYDVLISANLLRRLGSKADFWIWIQMSPDSALDELPADDAKLLQALGIRIKQLDKPKTQSFASLVYDKFRTLQMTNYKRVMFLDADIIPLVNLDYLFHLSDPDEIESPTILRPNLIMASRGEPCNTGMFMVEPGQGAWESLQDVIQKQHESGKSLPYPHFDFRYGWGHNFSFNTEDVWEGIERRGNRWHFHAGHSDQGLMYYFAKYVRQDVSIAIGDRIQNWLPSGQEIPRKVFDVKGALAPWSPKPIAYQENCDTTPEGNMVCFSPYRDVAHFMGTDKPWQRGVNKPFMKQKNTTFARVAPHRLWFKELEALNTKYNMSLDIKNWDDVHMEQMKESPLGYMAMYKDQMEVIGGKQNATNATQIAEKPE